MATTLFIPRAPSGVEPSTYEGVFPFPAAFWRCFGMLLTARALGLEVDGFDTNPEDPPGINVIFPDQPLDLPRPYLLAAITLGAVPGIHASYTHGPSQVEVEGDLAHAVELLRSITRSPEIEARRIADFVAAAVGCCYSALDEAAAGNWFTGWIGGDYSREELNKTTAVIDQAAEHAFRNLVFDFGFSFRGSSSNAPDETKPRRRTRSTDDEPGQLDNPPRRRRVAVDG